MAAGERYFIKSRGVAIAAAVTVTCGLLRYLGRRRAFGSHVRRAWLGKDARRMALSAYWDSGNQLRDPYTGQPICILSYSLAENLWIRQKTESGLCRTVLLEQRTDFLR